MMDRKFTNDSSVTEFWLFHFFALGTLPLKGGRGCLMPLSCVEIQGCRLIPPFISPVSFFFALSSGHFYFILYIYFLLMVRSPPEKSATFFVKG